MDNKELRNVLLKKRKKELMDLLNVFSKICPQIPVNFDASKLKQDILASRVWQMLLLAKAEYFNEFTECIQYLAEEEKSEKEIKVKHETTPKDKDLQTLKTLQFIADDICRYLNEIITHDDQFMDLWNSEREFYGFISLLGRNNISIPDALFKMLYLKIFKDEKDIVFEKSLLINYARYHLDLWEKDFKIIFSILTNEEIDLILSLHLLYDWIVNLLERRREKIIYDYDDIPLMKRVILAQYLKILEGSECSDNELDRMAELLKKIINDKIKGYSIEILPWGDLE